MDQQLVQPSSGQLQVMTVGVQNMSGAVFVVVDTSHGAAMSSMLRHDMNGTLRCLTQRVSTLPTFSGTFGFLGNDFGM